MNTIIKIIDQVPKYIFDNSVNELIPINWEFPEIPDSRRHSIFFKTSYAVHLRVHKTDSKKLSVMGYSSIIECVDTKLREKYIANNILLDWIYNRVKGVRLGRVMLVNLLPGGTIANHIDPGEYFKNYKRFHVPLVTNSGVVFTGSKDNIDYHMPVGMLAQLNNLNIHGVKNISNEGRIHMIADIDTKELEFQF